MMQMTHTIWEKEATLKSNIYNFSHLVLLFSSYYLIELYCIKIIDLNARKMCIGKSPPICLYMANGSLNFIIILYKILRNVNK